MGMMTKSVKDPVRPRGSKETINSAPPPGGMDVALTAAARQWQEVETERILRSDSPVLLRMMVCHTRVSAAKGPKSQAGGETVRPEVDEAAEAGRAAEMRQSIAVLIASVVPILA